MPRRRSVPPNSLERKANRFAALSDPLRLRILQLVHSEAGLCVSDIANRLGVSQPLVSHHLRVLRQANLIVLERQGQMQCPKVANQSTVRMLNQL